MQPPHPPRPPYGGPPTMPGMGGYGPPGPPGPPGWGPPPGGPRKPNNGAAVVIVVVAVFVLLIGGGAGLWFIFSVGASARSAVSVPMYSPPDIPTPPTYSPPPLPPLPTFTPPDDLLSSPPPTSYAPVFNPQPGDCVKNTGTYSHPRLYISGCTPGHYRIIDRIDHTTNPRRCASTGYTYAAWFTSPAYVLCMRRL